MGFGGSKTCPQCHRMFLQGEYLYCPLCGVKLDDEIPVVEVTCPICHGTGKIKTNKY